MIKKHLTRKQRKKKRGKKQKYKRKTTRRRKGERKSKRKKRGGTCDNGITWSNESELQQLLREYIQNDPTKKFIIKIKEIYDDNGELLPTDYTIQDTFHPDIAMMSDFYEFYDFYSVRQDRNGNPEISISAIFEDFLDGTIKIKREHDRNWWQFIGNW